MTIEDSTLRTHIRAQIQSLIVAFELLEQEKLIIELFDLLTVECLGLKVRKLTPKWSAINNNGVPFQFVVSEGSKYRSLRFMTEVAASAFQYPERLTRSYERLQVVCDYLSMSSHYSLIKKIGELLLPNDQLSINSLSSGAIWIGLGFAEKIQPRLTVYFEARWGRAEARWVRIFEFLRIIGCCNAATEYRKLIRPAAKFSQPVGIAVDFNSQGIDKIKLYFRSFRSTTEEVSLLLQEAGIPNARESIELLRNAFFNHTQRFPSNSLVYYLAVSPLQDQIEGTKVDVCSHCIGFNDDDHRKRWLDIAQNLNINIDDYLVALKEISTTKDVSTQCTHAFMGIGIARNGKIKLNAYLRPDFLHEAATMEVKRSPTKKITTTIGVAIEYILSHQDMDGAWRDFNLPPGRSDSWTTAYIGRCLLEIPQHFKSALWTKAIENSTRWLKCNINQDAGWGYNKKCETDSDSTAIAVLFLNRAGCPVSSETYKCLWSFQQLDGGFSTYQSSDVQNSWCISHADVTPMVIRALLEVFPLLDPRISKSLKYIERIYETSGNWNSFWWSSYHYATAHNLSLLSDLGRITKPRELLKLSKSYSRDTPFKQALMLVAMNALDDTSFKKSLISALQDSQLEDGSWLSAPILRVTDNTCREPWVTPNAGKLYADDKKLFITATVVDAMVR